MKLVTAWQLACITILSRQADAAIAFERTRLELNSVTHPGHEQSNDGYDQANSHDRPKRNEGLQRRFCQEETQIMHHHRECVPSTQSQECGNSSSRPRLVR